jgi:uncharacterized protein
MRVVVFVLLLLSSSSCERASANAPSKPATTTATSATAPEAEQKLTMATVLLHGVAGDTRVAVELAITDAQRQRGLMFRKQMNDDDGMLFLFEKQRPQSFWMKNTFLPLDMIFIDDSMKIAGIVENAEPQTLTPRGVPAPSRFVLELNAGLAQKWGLRAGQSVAFEDLNPALFAPLPGTIR